MSRETILNAFMPAAGIEDPHRFAGRKSQVKDLADALLINSSVPLIIGQRGLGKSSLALQLSRIAQGDVELLDQLGLNNRAIPPERAFITFFISCTDATKNLTGLLQELINAIDALKAERAKETEDRFRLVDKTTRRRLSMKFFSSETTKTYEEQRSAPNLKKFSLTERLIHLTQTLTDVYRQPVLFVIDEFDRIAPVKGLASFLKSHSSEILKFAFVGIGANQAELISDHASLPRQLVAVSVNRMKKLELESIIERTEEFLHENGEAFSFSKQAKEELARVASGFPWFVHVIGQSALVAAEDNGSRDITKARVAEAVNDLARNRFAQQFNDQYLRAVKDSSHREYMLRLFALWDDTDVPTSGIYPRARGLGVTAPATYVGHLTGQQYGPVLVRSHQQSRALYRFQDAMFKVYVRLRPSLFDQVKEQCDEVMH